VKGKLFLFLAITLFVPYSLQADIVKRHVNSNHADQIVCNEDEVWVRAEYGGLTRWDLETGEPVRFYTGNGFPTDFVCDFDYDDADRLLVLTSYDIYRFEGNSFEYLTSAPSYTERMTFADGYILVPTSRYGNGEGVSRFDGEKWEKMPELEGYKATPQTADPRGGFWFTARLYSIIMVGYYKDGFIKSYRQSQVVGIPDMDEGRSIMWRIDVDDSGVVWVSLSGGIAWFDGEEWSQYWWDKEMFRYPAKNATRDNDGVVWVARGIKGLLKYDDNEWFEVPQYEGENVLWVDKEPRGGIWVGTEECLEHFDGTNRVEYKIDNLLPISNWVLKLEVDDNGNLWCGDYYGDIAYLQRNTWSHFRGREMTDAEWAPHDLRSLLASKHSGVWAGFKNDIVRYDGNLWTSYYDILSPEIGCYISDIVEGPEGEVWIASNNGVVNGIGIWKDDEWEFYHPFGVSQQADMDFDPDGNLLILSGNLWIWDGKEWAVLLSATDFPEMAFQSEVLTIMEDGSIWIGATYCVFVVYEGEVVSYYTGDDGLPFLPNDPDKYIGVSSIEQAPDGSIWILTNSGLVHYDGIQFKLYENKDTGGKIGGIDLAITTDGRIFLAGRGLTEFTPTSVTLKMNLFADKVMYDAGDELTLSLMVNNYGPDEIGDLYFVMVSPDGKVYSAMEWSESVHPAVSDITIPEGFRMPMMPVLTLSLPSEGPPISMPGQYLFAVALADSGTTYFRAKAVTTVEVK